MGQVFLGRKAIPLENRRFTQFLFLSLLPVLSLASEETSVEEGMTRPSRGQCDAGHVIPPAVLVSISSVPLHSVDRELGPIRSDSRSPAGSLGSESGLLGPFLLPTRLLGPALPSSVLSAAGPHGRVGAGTVPCNPYPRRGPPPASCPSVLSTMPPLSDLCQTPHLASL